MLVNIVNSLVRKKVYFTFTFRQKSSYGNQIVFHVAFAKNTLHQQLSHTTKSVTDLRLKSTVKALNKLDHFW